MAGFLELLRRQADQVQRRVAADLVEEIAQAQPAVKPSYSLELSRHDEHVVVTVRSGVTASVRAKEKHAFRADTVPQPFREARQDRTTKCDNEV